MDPEELFARTRVLWPELINLNCEVGAQIDDIAIWPLVQVYDQIESRIGNDEWLSLAAWAFSQALHGRAKQAIAYGSPHLFPNSVTFEEFDHWMRRNLADDSWATLRDEYGRANP